MALVTPICTASLTLNVRKQKNFKWLILSTATKGLKIFKSTRTRLRSRIKKFFWKYNWHKYHAKFLKQEIPRMGFVTKTLCASLAYKWRKTFFYKKKKKKSRGLFAFLKRKRTRLKYFDRGPFYKEKRRGRKAHRQFIRNLLYNFKRILGFLKKFLAKKVNMFINYITPLQHVKKRRKISAEFSLVNRAHLTLRVLKRKFMSFLYKKPKFVLLKLLKTGFLKKKNKKRKRITLINLYKKYAWKLRCARYVHWDLRTLGKLNEWRYQKLLGVEVRALHTTRRSQFLNYVFMRCFCITASWRSLKHVMPYTPLVYNGRLFFSEEVVEKGDIVELPAGTAFRLVKKIYFKYFRRLVGRVKKLSYRSYLIRTKKRKHAKVYTKVPKAFKNLPVGLKRFGRSIAHELLLNAIAIIKLLANLSHDFNSKVALSSVIALQTWRYRFD